MTTNREKLAKMTNEEFKILREKAEKNGDAILSVEEVNQLAPYKVDNAIIMAAGYSARCMPLSNVLPKGLFCVKGEILIECCNAVNLCRLDSCSFGYVVNRVDGQITVDILSFLEDSN